jgi:hypothetical protein
VLGKYAHDQALGVPTVDEGQSSERAQEGGHYAWSDDDATKEVEKAARFAFGAVGTLAGGVPVQHVGLHLCGVGLSGDTAVRQYYGRKEDTEVPLFSLCWRSQVLFQTGSCLGHQ